MDISLKAGRGEALPWSVTPEKIQAAVQRIVRMARPRRVILFGSAARDGDSPPNDMDLLTVVGDDCGDTRQESVRLRNALSDILMPMDLLVITEGQLRTLKDRPGLIYREILSQGRLMFDSDGLGDESGLNMRPNETHPDIQE